MSQLTYELAQARLDDLLREAADWRRANESREPLRGVRPAATRRRRLMPSFGAPRRTVRRSAQGPAA